MARKRYFNIDVPKRHSVCAKGEEKLAPGSDCYSVVVEEDEGFSRSDFCPTCWKEIINSNQLEGTLTHWKTKVPEKEAIKEVNLDRDESALALLKQSAGSELEEERQEAFILSLYLARRRQILQRKEFSKEDGSPALIFEVAKSGEAIIVDKLTLSSLQTEKVQKALAKKMNELCNT